MKGWVAVAVGLVLAAVAAGRVAAGSPGDDVIAKILSQNPAPNAPASAAVGATASPPRSQGPQAIVMSARIGEHADRTRFVVEISDPVAMRIFTLNAPNRVVIDMPAVQWHLSAPPRPTGDGAVRSYRYGLFRPGNSRFVIDLNKPVAVSSAVVVPPEAGYGYRIIIDLFPATQSDFDHKAGWPADLKAREAAAERIASLPPARPGPTEKQVIVIDAGHGGIDAGTTGINGLLEKDLVLDEAKRLARLLARRANYDVHLTRDSDIYVPLNERVSISRSEKADLFISLHADSNPDPEVSGLSIYTQSERGSDREAAALARKENQSDVIAGVDLSGGNSTVAPILIDLAQRDTMNRSSHFAQVAVTSLARTTDILTRDPHRAAAFVVLKAPDVPSVLIELGYLSNRHDAAQMSTAQWRAATAQAIASAVDGYFAPASASGNGQEFPQ
jgi:N-acetylmuramoyl-L-alanine amidase